MLPVSVGQKITGTVEKLVFGGAGLIRHNGFVIFVPDVIPKETVVVEITSIKRRYAEGILISVEKPSEKRIPPLCPYSGRCGGCQLQHIDPQCHPSFKKEWLHTALYHGSQSTTVDFDIVATSSVYGWRRKITLHALWKNRQWVFGFFAKDNESILPISWCPLFFSDDEKSIIGEINQALHLIPGTSSAQIDVTLFRLPTKKICLVATSTIPISQKVKSLLIRAFKRFSCVQSFSIRSPNTRYDSGSTECTFTALRAKWHYSIDAFIQNHPTLSEVLWGDIINIIDATNSKQTVLDLYSGIGVTAISLAKQGHCVTAVELSEAAVQAAQRSAKEILGDDQKRVSFVQSSVEDFLLRVEQTGDFLIVNPPRTGLSKSASSAILEKAPMRIVYVSCSPPTLARDLALFQKEGWKIVYVRGYDMFPQTTHFETIVVIEKTLI
jgi:23S rRNA (uracil1939-C5)-methyltransferase